MLKSSRWERPAEEKVMKLIALRHYDEFIRSFLTGKGVFLLLAPEQKLQEVN